MALEQFDRDFLPQASLLCVLLLAGCTGQDSGAAGPFHVFGTADASRGGGTVRNVSMDFDGAEVEALYRRLNSSDFQALLTPYNCGDPVPHVDFTTSLWPDGTYQERHVLIQPRPMFSPGGRERCLEFGLGHLIDLEVARIDRGEPIQYHYRDPLSGKDLLLSAEEPEEPREPLCDCAKRDAGGEWVTWVVSKKPRPAADAAIGNGVAK
ncbi:MAG: hypothetical protein ABI689_18720 [Thermoanaerobaculia bacterium]